MTNHHIESNFTPEFAVTPEMFFDDHHSEEAQENLQLIEEAKREGNRTAVDACSDARTAPKGLFKDLRTQLVTLRSIAVGIPAARMIHVLSHQGVKRFMELTHFDGRNISPGRTPGGCGGQGVKARLESNEIPAEALEHPVVDFVGNNVNSSDIFWQGYQRARDICRKYPDLRDKQFLVAAVDHITAQIYPMAVVGDGGRIVQAGIPIEDLHKPEVLYETGFPQTIDLGRLPDEFAALIEDNMRKSAELNEDPSFQESQVTQNPHMVVISDSIIDPGLRYPGLLSGLNKAFKISVPIRKEVGTDGRQHVHIPPGAGRIVLAQLRYPVGEGLHATSPRDPFFNTGTLLFEARRLSEAKRLAHEALEDPVMQQWAEQRNEGRVRQVFAARVVSGRTTTVDRVF